MAYIGKRLSLLQPIPIDPSKCNKNKSLYWQILNNSHVISKRQKKQFDLGNSQTFTDPIKAAEYLLQREYCDTFLFNGALHEAVFIPPIFVSNQYTKKSTVAILDYEVKKNIERLLANLKEHTPEQWLFKELNGFLQSQKETIGQDTFQKWIFNVKIMYLVSKELKDCQLNLQPTTSDLNTFVQSCIKELTLKLPTSPLITFLNELLHRGKGAKKRLIAEIEKNRPHDSNLKWLFGLELAEIGEKIEHRFYDKLLPLKDNILQDTVVLSSVNFMTNVRNKMHRESDFLIIFWKRKLVISVEMKQKITHVNKLDETLEQLNQNHELFEERLGDQLSPGWTFYPVICVEKDTLLLNSRHYISMETEISPWLESIFYRFPVVTPGPQQPTPLDDVKKLLQIIVFAVHVSKKCQIAPITSTNRVKYTSNAIDNVSTSDNIVFYSNEQLAVMNGDDPRYRKLIIQGPWGTGKSTLLRDKAIQLNKLPEFKGRVMYLIKNILLYHRLKIYLEEKHGIIVVICEEPEIILQY